MRNSLIGIFGLLLSLTVAAQVVTLKPGVPERYVVRSGDTLWDISNMFLEDPWLWPDIWHVNPQINNPHLIFPGDVIGFITVDGETKITTITRTEKVMSDGTLKLEPRVRTSLIEGAIPAIPRNKIAGFLSNNRIFARQELDSAPYVLGGHEGRIVLGAGDKIFARGDFGVEPLPAYEIFRPGQSYIDPQTEELLGYEARSLGVADFINRQGTVTTLTISRSSENIRLQDRLISTSQDQLVSTYFPSAPDADIQGEIMSVVRGVSSIGQYDVVLLNLGSRESMEAGHVMNIWRRGELVNDPIAQELVRLPSERAGMLMIFKTFEKMSYGLVLDTTRPLSVGDEVRTPGY